MQCFLSGLTRDGEGRRTPTSAFFTMLIYTSEKSAAECVLPSATSSFNPDYYYGEKVRRRVDEVGDSAGKTLDQCVTYHL